MLWLLSCKGWCRGSAIEIASINGWPWYLQGTSLLLKVPVDKNVRSKPMKIKDIFKNPVPGQEKKNALLDLVIMENHWLLHLLETNF